VTYPHGALRNGRDSVTYHFYFNVFTSIRAAAGLFIFASSAIPESGRLVLLALRHGCLVPLRWRPLNKYSANRNGETETPGGIASRAYRSPPDGLKSIPKPTSSAGAHLHAKRRVMSISDSLSLGEYFRHFLSDGKQTCRRDACSKTIIFHRQMHHVGSFCCIGDSYRRP